MLWARASALDKVNFYSRVYCLSLDRMAFKWLEDDDVEESCGVGLVPKVIESSVCVAGVQLESGMLGFVGENSL